MNITKLYDKIVIGLMDYMFPQDYKSWFAWHPVQTNDQQIVWLETVKRRCRYGNSSIGLVYYDYEKIKKEKS
jgi:hypothetical protein